MKRKIFFGLIILSVILNNVAVFSISSTKNLMNYTLSQLESIAMANPENDNYTCTSGGPGSTSCSVSVSGSLLGGS